MINEQHWLESLSTLNPQVEFALKLSRASIKAIQPSEQVRKELRPSYDSDAEKLIAALKHFRHKKHEVIALQILDPAEVSFPFDDVTRIEDMETAREVTSDPQAFRNAYLEEFGKFMNLLRAGCRGAGIDLVTAQTNQRFDLFLGNYLARRQAMMA